MALDIVEGYVIDETKPWCAPFARSHNCPMFCNLQNILKTSNLFWKNTFAPGVNLISPSS